MNKPLHDVDFLRWTIAQAAALRHAGTMRINTPDPIDWESVAEEIESLGRSERAALRSRIAVVLEHLFKLALLPATDPRAGWLDTIDTQRREIRRLLKDSPSLKREVPALIADELPDARSLVARVAARHRETLSADPASVDFDAHQVLDDRYPPEP